MGTSTNYSAPPNWGELKKEISRLSKHGHISNLDAKNVLRTFIKSNGGPEKMARGRGVIGRTRSSQSVAQNFTGFISQVESSGIQAALEEGGLGHLVDEPVEIVLSAIIDLCAGPGGTIDEVDARNAFVELLDEELSDAETVEDVEASLSGLMTGGGLPDLLIKYFGNCVFEYFCRVFFEQISSKHGFENAKSFMAEIKGFIREALKTKTYEMNIEKIDWSGDEGSQIMTDVLEVTLAVFGGE